MSFRIIGNDAMQQLPSRRRRNTDGSWTTFLRYKGFEAQALAVIGSLDDDAEADITPENDGESPYVILEYSVGDAQDGSEPSEENLKPQWSLLGNDLEKDLYEFPGIALAGGDPTNPEDRAIGVELIKRCISAIEANEATVTDYTGSWLGNAVALRVFLLKVRGVESYVVSQYVLQRTVILPKGYAATWPIDNVGKQYTTTALIAAEAVPEEIKFTMPAGAWLKKAPSIVPDGSGRYQVNDEWWHADTIDEVVYPPVT